MDQQLGNRQGLLGSELDAEAPVSVGGATVSLSDRGLAHRRPHVAFHQGRRLDGHTGLAPRPDSGLSHRHPGPLWHRYGNMAADADKTKAGGRPTAAMALMDVVSAPCSTVDSFFSGAILQAL